jgi:hypothetical protein
MVTKRFGQLFPTKVTKFLKIALLFISQPPDGTSSPPMSARAIEPDRQNCI